MKVKGRIAFVVVSLWCLIRGRGVLASVARQAARSTLKHVLIY